jgi:hypothetical protein
MDGPCSFLVPLPARYGPCRRLGARTGKPCPGPAGMPAHRQFAMVQPTRARAREQRDGADGPGPGEGP